jgi:hypothetical protein
MGPASELTSTGSPPYTLLSYLQISFRLEPPTEWNSVSILCLACTSTISTILHCCCVECTWLTATPVILWIWTEILHSTTLDEIKCK